MILDKVALKLHTRFPAAGRHGEERCDGLLRLNLPKVEQARVFA